ncbi:MAG: phosphoribosylglycinamide formyltransferase 1 [Chloroflexota bacterium]|jgi:phosphoribosylglycinamide formyltransferase-1|nr:phosphoribosylglycinamide formyltransferase 1 [Chloroflexota bacterium]
MRREPTAAGSAMKSEPHVFGARPMRRLPIGVLLSGQGTNLEAILRACDTGSLDAEVRLVASNRPSAPGLEHGRRRGIATEVFARAAYGNDREAQQEAILARLEASGVELVVLAGFDQILSDAFVARYSFRMINLHPSLLPAFGGGMHAIRDALDWGAKVTGCTVHFVAAEFPDADSGPIILQEAVPVREDDTEETLLARVHEAEHRLMPAAIQLFAEGRIQREGRRVRILPPAASSAPKP